MSDNVSLRPIRLDDWPAVHSWAKLPEASRFQAWGPDTEEQTREFVRGAASAWDDQPRTHHVYAAQLSGEVVGIGELHVRDATHRQGEIAYSSHPKLWGRGVGTAIARELLEIGFGQLKLHRIFATADPRNVASTHIQERLGMTYEGRLREVMRIADGWRDSDVRSILAREWRERP